MGRIQSPDAVAKNSSTSLYGNIVSLAGVAEGRGAALRRHRRRPRAGDARTAAPTGARSTSFPGVPEMHLRLAAERLAALRRRRLRGFRQPQDGRLQALLLKRSADRGRSWVSIAGNLPERGTVYSLAEDPVKPSLLFAGTEFGLFVTVDGGLKWIEAVGRPADHRGQGPGHPEAFERPGARDLRARLLRPRRLLGAARGRRQGARRPGDPASRPPRPGSTCLRPASATARRASSARPTSSPTIPPFGATFTYYLKEALEVAEEAAPGGREGSGESQEGDRLPDASTRCAPRPGRRTPGFSSRSSDAAGNVVRRLERAGREGDPPPDLGPALPAAPIPPSKEEKRSDFGPPSTGPLVAPGSYSREDRPGRRRRHQAARRRRRPSRSMRSPTPRCRPRTAPRCSPSSRRSPACSAPCSAPRTSSASCKERLALIRAAIAKTPALDPGDRRQGARAGAPARGDRHRALRRRLPAPARREHAAGDLRAGA